MILDPIIGEYAYISVTHQLLAQQIGAMVYIVSELPDKRTTAHREFAYPNVGGAWPDYLSKPEIYPGNIPPEYPAIADSRK